MPRFLSVMALLHPAARIGWQYFSVHWSTVAGIAGLWVLYEWRVRVHRRAGPAPGEPGGRSGWAKTGWNAGPSVDDRRGPRRKRMTRGRSGRESEGGVAA